MTGSINLSEWVDVDEMFPDKPEIGAPIEAMGDDGLVRKYTREIDGSVTYSLVMPAEKEQR
jgi:hypothetical protein